MTDETDTADTSRVLAVPNVTPLELERNLRKNVAKGWKFLPYTLRVADQLIVLGGGPSLNDNVELIRGLSERRIPIVTLNGAYQWATDHHLFPAYQIVVDARVESAAFTRPAHPGTKYLIAETCAPETFEGLPLSGTFMWSRKEIMGGSTVMLCAIPLLRTMGMRFAHIFGFDSCISRGHHAYPQHGNDADQMVEVTANGRTFQCAWWMSVQAEEFLDLYRNWGDFNVYGDGLISTLMYGGEDINEDEG